MEKRSDWFFFNFRGPPNTLHIPVHSSDRERMWPKAHCHVRDFRAFSTMCNSQINASGARSIFYSQFILLPSTYKTKNLSLIQVSRVSGRSSGVYYGDWPWAVKLGLSKRFILSHDVPCSTSHQASFEHRPLKIFFSKLLPPSPISLRMLAQEMCIYH